MSDEDSSSALIPLPPDSGLWRWLEKIHQQAGGLVRTAEFGVVVGCIGIACTSGGDMSLVIPFLVIGWVVGTIGIGGISKISPMTKSSLLSLLSFLFVGVWAFIFVHFQKLPLAEATTKPASQISAADRPLKNLSNRQLRDAIIEFSKKMRDFESSADVVEIPSYSKDDTEEQRQQKWNSMVQRGLARSKAKSTAFANNYLGQARELRDEIIYRLKETGILEPLIDTNPLEEIGPMVLDNGMLAGPYPVTAAANYLERLARRLPEG